MEFNTKNFNAFRTDVQAALQDVEEKYNIKISCNNIKYDNISFTMQMSATRNTNNAMDEKETFEDQCRIYGFMPSDYLREFYVNGKKYRLTGFNPKARKHSCNITETETGTVYKAAPEIVKNAMGNI